MEGFGVDEEAIDSGRGEKEGERMVKGETGRGEGCILCDFDDSDISNDLVKNDACDWKNSIPFIFSKGIRGAD